MLRSRARRIRDRYLRVNDQAVAAHQFGAEYPPASSQPRSQERDRRARLSAASALGARGLTLALTLVSVPLTLNYLGTERYGMWLTISSLIALLSFSDLGIGYGVLNAVTRSLAAGNIRQARMEIASALALLGGVAGVLCIALFVALPLADWPRLLKAESSLAGTEAAPAMLAFAFIFLIGLPLSIATQVRVARQEAYIVHAAAAAGNLLAIGALLLVIGTRQGVPALVIAMAAPPLITSGVSALHLFAAHAPELRPRRELVDWAVAITLVKAGFLFLVLQLAITVAFASDTIVLAHVLGPAAVSEYGVAFRLFTIPMGIVAIGLTPLWPAYGEAIATGDVAWVRRTLAGSIQIAAALGFVGACLFVIFGASLVNLWVGTAVTPSFSLLLGLGVWTVQAGIGQAVAMFLNGANEVRIQAMAASVMAVTNVVVSIWLTTRIGAAGVVWATVTTYGVFVLVPMSVYVPRVLNKLALVADETFALRP